MQFRRKRMISAGMIATVILLSLISITVPVPSTTGTLDAVSSDDPAILNPTRYGGYIEWYRNLKDCTGYQVSTPTLVDLDNDRDLEIVVLSSNGDLHAIRPDGGHFWQNPFSEREVDIAGQGPFSPENEGYIPPFFSSTLAIDLNLGDTPEIIFGAKGGIVCVGSDGEYQWKIKRENATVISTPGIADLHAPGKNKEDREIAVVMEDHNGSSFIELYEVDGDIISSTFMGNMSRGTASAVVSGNLDPAGGAENELFVMHPHEGFQSYRLNGSTSGLSNLDMTRSFSSLGYQASTPVIANVSGGPEKEILISTSYYNGSDPTLDKTIIRVLDRDMNEIGRYENIGENGNSYSSPVVADEKYGKYPEPVAKDIIFSTYDGMVHIIEGEDPDGSLDVKLSFDTGGTIISSPAILNINNDEDYEIIVATVEGKIFCIESDPTDGIDEGIPYPGDGITQDVLWVQDIGTEIGISSPVVGDIDLDGRNEVLIGDSNGTVYCIDAGITHYNRMQGWPTFHGNVNRTGYYDLQFYIDVDIHPRTDPETGVEIEVLEKYAQPGTWVTYNLTIHNTGKGISEINKNLIYVSIRSIPEGWGAYIDTPPDRGNDNPEYVRLASQETAYIQLQVRAPWEGDLNEMAEIEVVCSSYSGASDSIRTRSILDLFFDQQVNFLVQPSSDPLDPLVGLKWSNISPGSNGLYVISILNKGNVNDTYDISLNPPPLEAGWKWSFVETGTREVNVSLVAPPLMDRFGGVTGTDFTINVTVPDEVLAGTRVVLTLRSEGRVAKENSQEPSTMSDTLMLIVTREPGIEMVIENDIVFTEINGSAKVFVDITNTGNLDVQNVILTIEGRPPGWLFKYQEEPIPVSYRQTKRVTIRITAPGHGGYPMKDLRVKVLDLFSEANSSFTIRIQRHTNFDLDIIPNYLKYIEPGESIFYELKIHNTGNADEIVAISHSSDIENIDLDILFDGNDSLEMFEIERGKVFYYNLTLIAGTHVPAGVHTININISTVNGYSRTTTIRVEVIKVTDLRIIAKDGTNARILSLEPGDSRIFDLGIENRGNHATIVDLDMMEEFDSNTGVKLLFSWDLTFLKFRKGEFQDVYDQVTLPVGTVTVSELDEGREYPYYDEPYHRNRSFQLEQDETIWVKFEIKVPHFNGRELVLSRDLVFMAEVRNSSVSVSYPIMVKVLYPDLEIVDDPTFGNDDGPETIIFKEGENITVFVSVLNNGTIRSKNAKIDFFLDDLIIGGYWIEPLDPGNSRSFGIEIGPIVTDHTLRIEIDRNNDVFELNDQFMERSIDGSNIREYELLLDEDDPEEEWHAPGWFIGMNIGLVLVMLIVSGSILVRLNANRKGLEYMEE